MAVDPGQFIDAIIASLAELHQFSVRRLEFDVGLLEKFAILSNLEIEALALFGVVLASLFELSLVLRLHLLHFCL